MINVVIAGAGEVGRHIASLLSKQNHNVILVDINEKKLEQATADIDVAFREGSATDWQLLMDLLEFSPNFFLAMTHDDEINLVACSIAKQLGYPRTIARVRDQRFLSRSRLDFSRLFYVDYFIGPELTAAYDILRYILSPSCIAIEMLAHGMVQLQTVVIPEKWPRAKKTLRELKIPEGMIIALIRRQEKGQQEPKVIFPHGDDWILPGDEVTLIGKTEILSHEAEYFGSLQKLIQNIVIVGGSTTAFHLAKHLEHRGIHIRIIEKNYERCCWLADQLPKCTIIHRDASEMEFLQAEKIGNTDLLAVCTSSDELNVLIALLGKEVGCKDAVVLLSNASYGPMLKKLGISFTASPRVSAAHYIVSLLSSGLVSSLVPLYENQAQIMEISVTPQAKIIGAPLSELSALLPKELLIAVILRHGRVIIAKGNSVISAGDTVIAVVHPKHVRELEKMF